MSRVIEALARHARTTPHTIALEDGARSLSYAQLSRAVEHAALRLRKQAAAGRSVALLADNGSAWAIADLAALHAGIPIVPLPAFFSPTQTAHALRACGAACVLTDQPERVVRALRADADGSAFGEHLAAVDTAGLIEATDLPARTWKITFTSGTTGEPRGVCLTRHDLERTAQALCDATDAGTDDRHLCALPLATLLENIGGIYAPLLAGATICAPPAAALGLSGSSGLDIVRFVAALHGWRPGSAILVPQMLQALVRVVRAGARAPQSLRYVAVGGAPISTSTLREATGLGLPAYEGYGLSECGSVVALNRPGAVRPGSVGKPLPHVDVSIAPGGEIIVGGVAWLGYVGERGTARPHHPVATGDLGFIDADGFLHLTGRRRNVFITSFGRNVAPEWIERELVARPPILQAAVFGDGRPFNTAVVFADPAVSEPAIQRAIDQANADLPDYARAHAWLRAGAPFGADNGLSTPNGRPRREAIRARYADRIDAIYAQQRQECNELLPAT